MKRLIINADDFGFTRDVNAGIVRAHLEGVLTSTTLMANGDAFADAVDLAKRTPSLDIGAHLVLVQGRSVLNGNVLPDRPRDLLRILGKRELDPYPELRAQIEKILAAGLRPTHLDSHKHTHIVPKVFRAVVRLAHEFRIPYVRLPLDTTLPLGKQSRRLLRAYYERMAHGYDVKMTEHFLGFRLTGSLSEASFAAALALIKNGTTEFMCHPGLLGPELQKAQTRLKESRARELEALISPRVRAIILTAGIELTSFGNYPNVVDC